MPSHAWLPTPGSVENLQLLERGDATFAFTAADAASDAYDGRRVPLRAVARVYDDYIHLVVPRDRPSTTSPACAGGGCRWARTVLAPA